MLNTCCSLKRLCLNCFRDNNVSLFEMGAGNVSNKASSEEMDEPFLDEDFLKTDNKTNQNFAAIQTFVTVSNTNFSQYCTKVWNGLGRVLKLCTSV